MIKVTTTGPQVIYFICYKILDLTKGERNKSLNFPTSPISLLSSFLCNSSGRLYPSTHHQRAPKDPSSGVHSVHRGGGGRPCGSSLHFRRSCQPEGGFIFPLVDPWYEISSLFLCKSFGFPSPPEDWEWTVMGPEVVVDRAWVPCLDEISDLLIQKGDIRSIPINFEFLCAVSKDWSQLML